MEHTEARERTPQQRTERLVLAIAILASFVTFLDGSVINVALPAISEELGGGLTVQQWVVDAYLITLGTLILLAGSLSDDRVIAEVEKAIASAGPRSGVD